MFKLSNKNQINNVITNSKDDLKVKTTNDIVKQIHDSFYTEVDKLLNLSKIKNSLDTDKKDLIKKCERLKVLGFTNTKEVKEAESEIERLNYLKKENEDKEKLIEAINYFSFKYPNYKFITEKSVKEICEKYNLVYGEIKYYNGSVPDENLKHMEDFRICEEDECYMFEESIRGLHIRGGSDSENIYVSFEEFKKEQPLTEDFQYTIQKMYRDYAIEKKYKKCSLEIVAPLKDFDMDGMKINGNSISKIEIPDPIVLKPVIFDNKKHYLIVTAWGIEAEDALIINANHN